VVRRGALEAVRGEHPARRPDLLARELLHADLGARYRGAATHNVNLSLRKLYFDRC
jgi:hypothetical protein